MSLTEKYRPKIIKDIVSHQHIIKSITNMINDNSLSHLLFYGPPGTGKTSVITAILNNLYNNELCYLKLNASDDRGINVVRNRIEEFSKTKSFSNYPYKFIILDEADYMTSDAQYALRKIMEEYYSNVRFCIICNYIHKIIPEIQSRCCLFRFLPLSKIDLGEKLKEIIEKENISITNEGFSTLIKCSNNDMRRSLHILEALSYKKIKSKHIYELTNKKSKTELKDIINIIKTNTYKDAYNILKNNIIVDNILIDLANLLLEKFNNKLMIKLAKLELSKKLPNSLKLSYLISIVTNEV